MMGWVNRQYVPVAHQLPNFGQLEKQSAQEHI